MTAPSAQIHVTPELLERFKAYHEKESVWGSLHIVLDDENLEDHHVEWCANYALENGDLEGWELAKILMKLSISQRKKISRKA